MTTVSARDRNVKRNLHGFHSVDWTDVPGVYQTGKYVS